MRTSSILFLFLVTAACGAHGSRPAPGGPVRSYEHNDSSSSYASATTSTGSEEAPNAEGAGDYEPAMEPSERPGLGTSFGEHRNSSIVYRRFVRDGATPFAQVALHYNDLEGIREQAWFRGMQLEELRATAAHGGLTVSVVDEYGRLLRGGYGNGRTYVVGTDGGRYELMVTNDTAATFEVVASVDGLDVVDGKPASVDKRGYIIAPYSTLRIDGFRTSEQSVAAFRFGSVRDSYAARTSGDRNVGVIGLAFFAERDARWSGDELRRRETADPFPNRYAQPPGSW